MLSTQRRKSSLQRASRQLPPPRRHPILPRDDRHIVELGQRPVQVQVHAGVVHPAVLLIERPRVVRAGGPAIDLAV
ncbi:MAG: hypothetical protein ACK55O_06960, partial [Phycisphaerales bacterium]